MSTETKNQYAPPKSSVADVGISGDAFNKANRGARLGAVLLDGLIGSVALVPAYISAFKVLAVQHATNVFSVWAIIMQTGGLFYMGAAVALIVLGINIYLMRQYGQTIGKKIVGIKVVGTDGSHVPLWRIFFVRYVCNTVLTMIPFLGGLYSLVDCLMIFGEPRRCVHDYLANTIVINA